MKGSLFKARHGIGLAVIALLMPVDAAELARGVRSGKYRDWSQSLLLEAGDHQVRLVAAPALGGRILNFSLEGINILWELEANNGRTLAVHGKETQAEGHQLDIGPELGGVPRHPQLWLGPWTSEVLGSYGIKLSSPSDPAVGVRLEKELVLDPESGALGILNRMLNESPQPTSYCFWDRTLCQGGGFAFFPRKDKSIYPEGWALKKKNADGTAQYSGSQHPNVQVIKDTVVVQCNGAAAKLGSDSDAGWIAYAWDHLLFIKYFPIHADGRYSDGGNTVEVYWDENRAEIEPLSPEITLQPGKSVTFPQQWILITLKNRVTSHKEARKLVKEVPENPFRNAPGLLDKLNPFAR